MILIHIVVIGGGMLFDFGPFELDPGEFLTDNLWTRLWFSASLLGGVDLLLQIICYAMTRLPQS